jgi:uncharacterized protein YaaR (DUF327 family)
MKNNDIKTSLNSRVHLPKKEANNSILYIDKKIIPFFSVPVILKRINDAKKDKNFSLSTPPKKLIYKIIKINEKLIKLTTSIKNYNLNLDSFFAPAAELQEKQLQ